MNQLAHALRAVGYLPSTEVRAERDRAIAKLVKARKHKRKSSDLKGRVLALVSALKIPAPVFVLALVLFCPSLAFAHAGHDHGPTMPDPTTALVLVGVTLGLAVHAWKTWGAKRPQLALATGSDDGNPFAGKLGELFDRGHAGQGKSGRPKLALPAIVVDGDALEPELLRCGCTGTDARLQIAAPGCLHCHGVGVTPIAPFGKEGPSIGACRSRAAWERKRAALVESLPYGAELAAGHRRTADAYDTRIAELIAGTPRPYYTVRIPYVATGATEWHPTTDTGPFNQLTRGAHRSLEAARAWANEHLAGHPYTVALVEYDPTAESDRVTTVYTSTFVADGTVHS